MKLGQIQTTLQANVAHDLQGDQIWRNFATLAKKKYLGNFLLFSI